MSQFFDDSSSQSSLSEARSLSEDDTARRNGEEDSSRQTPTSNRTEVTDQLLDLGVNLVDQNVLERKIMAQVNRPCAENRLFENDII